MGCTAAKVPITAQNSLLVCGKLWLQQTLPSRIRSQSTEFHSNLQGQDVKKLSIILLVVLLAIVLIAPVITGKALKEGQIAELARVSETNPDIDIALAETDSGWFSSNYQYQISFVLPDMTEPTTLSVDATHFHGPLTIGAVSAGEAPRVGLSSYTWTADVFAQLAEALKESDPEASEFLQQLPQVFGSGVVDFDGSTRSEAVLSAFSISKNSSAITSSDLVVNVTTKANGEIAAAALAVDKLAANIVSEESDSVLVLEGLAFDFASTASLAGMPIGDGNMTLKNLEIEAPELRLKASELVSSSVVDLSNDLLSYVTNVSAGGFSYNDFEIGPSTVQTSYSGLHLPSLLEMQEINARFAAPADASEEQVSELLVQQGQASQGVMLELLLNKPSIETHWDIEIFQQSAKLDLALNLDAITNEMATTMREIPAMGLIQMTGLVAGNLDLALPQQLVNSGAAYYVETSAADPNAEPMTQEQKQQAAEMISQMPVSTGYMIDDNGILTTKLELANGQTTLNGQPFPLLQLISQYAAQMSQQAPVQP